MIDLSVTLFFVPLALLLVLIYLHNRTQARTLNQMADSLDELYLLELKNRRTRAKKDIAKLNAFAWLASAAGGQYVLENCLSQSTFPSWLNLSIKNGGRLVVSPLAPVALRKALPDPKSLGRLGKSLELLLGHSPRNLQIFSRSLAEQEYFDLEAAEVGRQLGSGWGEVTRLWFYHIPASK